MPKSNPTLSALSWIAVDSIASSRTIVGRDDADDGGDHRMAVMVDRTGIDAMSGTRRRARVFHGGSLGNESEVAREPSCVSWGVSRPKRKTTPDESGVQ